MKLNFYPREAEIGKFSVLAQLELHSETLSKKKRIEKKDRKQIKQKETQSWTDLFQLRTKTQPLKQLICK